MIMNEAKPMKSCMRVFMLVHTEPMKEKEVMEELLKIEEVLEAHMITGQYDVLAVLQVKRHFLESEYQTIFDHAISKIEGVRHVMDTNTIIGWRRRQSSRSASS